jgi:hypothetical protein
VADDTNGAFDAYHLYSFDEAVGRRGWLRRVRIVGIAGTSSAVPLATTIHAWISDLLTQAGVGGLLAASVRFLDTHVNAPGNQELRTNSTFLADLRNRETPPLPVSIPIHTWGGTLD